MFKTDRMSLVDGNFLITDCVSGLGTLCCPS